MTRTSSPTKATTKKSARSKAATKDLRASEARKVRGGMVGCPCDGGEIFKKRRP